jgi:hypothetical protein
MTTSKLVVLGGALVVLWGCAGGGGAGTGPEAAAPARLSLPDAVNALVSFAVTTPGYTDRVLRHQNGAAVTSVIGASSDVTSRQDASFWVRPGLASGSCYSFESRNYPGQYLRHSNYRLRKDANDGSGLFAAAATFCAKAGLGGSGMSLASFNFPDRYLRHINAEVYIASSNGSNAWDGGGSFNADATWNVVPALWRSGADLPVGQTRTFWVVTAGFTDRVLRHQNGLAVTSVVGGSDGLGKQDATFTVRASLADTSCYSLESVNYQGSFLRHANFRVRLDANDGSALFKSDATFCAQPGLAGGDVSLASYNIAGKWVRHKNGEVWIGAASGVDPGDGNAGSFNPDATWRPANGLWTGGSDWTPLPPRSDGKWVRVRNGCPFTIWIHAASAVDQGNVVLTPDDASLSPGASHDYLAPNTWASARVTAYGDGPRAGELEKAEMTFGGGVLNYNVTYVDWVGLPLEVVGVGGGCTAAAHTTGCYARQADLTTGCPESFLRNGKQCLSARTYCANPVNQGTAYCHALDGVIASCASCPKDTTTNVYMCANLYREEPRWCAALNRGMTGAPDDADTSHYYVNPPYNTYARWVHQVCPNIYAFPYDDWLGQGGFRSCAGDEVRVTFCPNG